MQVVELTLPSLQAGWEAFCLTSEDGVSCRSFLQMPFVKWKTCPSLSSLLRGFCFFKSEWRLDFVNLHCFSVAIEIIILFFF